LVTAPGFGITGVGEDAVLEAYRCVIKVTDNETSNAIGLFYIDLSADTVEVNGCDVHVTNSGANAFGAWLIGTGTLRSEFNHIHIIGSVANSFNAEAGTTVNSQLDDIIAADGAVGAGTINMINSESNANLSTTGDILFRDDSQALFGTGTDASIDYDDDDNALVVGVPIASSEKGLIIADQVDVAADFNFGGLVTTTNQPVLSFVDTDTDSWFKVGFFNDDEPFLEAMSGDLLINPNYDQNVTFFEGVTTGTLDSGAVTSTLGYLYNAETTATPSGAFTVDWTTKHIQRVTITGAALDVTFTDPASPCWR